MSAEISEELVRKTVESVLGKDNEYLRRLLTKEISLNPSDTQLRQELVNDLVEAQQQTIEHFEVGAETADIFAPARWTLLATLLEKLSNVENLNTEKRIKLITSIVGVAATIVGSVVSAVVAWYAKK